MWENTHTHTHTHTHAHTQTTPSWSTHPLQFIMSHSLSPCDTTTVTSKAKGSACLYLLFNNIHLTFELPFEQCIHTNKQQHNSWSWMITRNDPVLSAWAGLCLAVCLASQCSLDSYQESYPARGRSRLFVFPTMCLSPAATFTWWARLRLHLSYRQGRRHWLRSSKRISRCSVWSARSITQGIR